MKGQLKDKSRRRGVLDRIVDEDSYGDDYDSERDSQDSNLSAH